MQEHKSVYSLILFLSLFRSFHFSILSNYSQFRSLKNLSETSLQKRNTSTKSPTEYFEKTEALPKLNCLVQLQLAKQKPWFPKVPNSHAQVPNWSCTSLVWTRNSLIIGSHTYQKVQQIRHSCIINSGRLGQNLC